MATKHTFSLSLAERKKRIFSEDFKRQKVREIELKQTSVSEVRKVYQVRPNNVHKWIDKYSNKQKKAYV
jgi:transposase